MRGRFAPAFSVAESSLLDRDTVVRNNRRIGFLALARASDFKVTRCYRSYSRCFLSVYLHGTPRRSLSNEILPEPVGPPKAQPILHNRAQRGCLLPQQLQLRKREVFSGRLERRRKQNLSGLCLPTSGGTTVWWIARPPIAARRDAVVGNAIRSRASKGKL